MSKKYHTRRGKPSQIKMTPGEVKETLEQLKEKKKPEFKDFLKQKLVQLGYLKEGEEITKEVREKVIQDGAFPQWAKDVMEGEDISDDAKRAGWKLVDDIELVELDGG